MITKKTCLLLGAGASTHLGFPLGAELKRQMLTAMDDWIQIKGSSIPPKLEVPVEDVKSFYEEMLHSNFSSPDAFLEKFPEHKRVGKYLMCEILSKKEIERNFISQAGWYQHLVNAIQVDKIEQLVENNLSIVTFNYDRSIDFKLHKFVQHHYRLSSDEAWQTLRAAIPIIHLHGTLGEYPEVPYGCTDDILERSNSIQILHETDESSEQTKENFAQASRFLNGAETVAVFGFGFGADNVRRLNFFKEQEKEERDLCVALGYISGSLNQQEVNAKMSKWGLKLNKHCYYQPCNEVFGHYRNPFVS
ncbi:MAG: hypothetical protein R3C12_01120 [Planctomycetaceae bacterium]|nr:hypothetical protein [Planctomycetaceae bacterium]